MMLGSYAPDFELPGIDDSVHHLARYLEKFDAVCVVFLSNSCPIVQLYLDRLKQIQTEFQDQGFTLIGISANDAVQAPEEDLAGMKQFMAKAQLNFPYLRDVTQDVALGFEVKATPEAFVINQRGILYYRGPIDDNPRDPGAVQKTYLRNAIDQLLSGETIIASSMPAMGSPIKWR